MSRYELVIYAVFGIGIVVGAVCFSRTVREFSPVPGEDYCIADRDCRCEECKLRKVIREEVTAGKLTTVK